MFRLRVALLLSLRPTVSSVASFPGNTGALRGYVLRHLKLLTADRSDSFPVVDLNRAAVP